MIKCYCDCSARNALLYVDRVLPVVTAALLVSMGTLAFLVIYSAGLTHLYPYAAFVLFQVCANWYQIRAYASFTDMSRKHGYSAPNAPYFCDKCNLNQTPEVHHCWVCDRCVYRRDHHCFVLGTCVGAHNQAFFIFLMAHLTMGCFVGAYYSAVFYEQLFGYWKDGKYEDFVAFFKFYQVVFAKGSTWTALIALFLNVTGFFAVSLFNFTVFQTFLVLRGQTQYEFLVGRKNHVTSFNLAWRKIFGPKWYLRLIFPFQCSYVISMAAQVESKTV